jgi:hypothetical protein
VVHEGLQKPLLMLSSGSGGADRDPSTQSLLAASGSTAWSYTIAGAEHFDFTDYAAYWLAAPVRAILPLGNPRTLAIADAYLAAFLAGGAAFYAPEIAGVRATYVDHR